MASKLTTKDLRTVRNAVYDAASKWYDLGLELGISPNWLDTIKKTYNDNPQDCLRQMLKLWLSNGEPTWEVLSDALCNQAVGFADIAEKILREKIAILKQESSGSEQSLSNQAECANSSTTSAKVPSSVSSPDLKKGVGSKSDSSLNLKLAPENDSNSIFVQQVYVVV